MVDVGSSLSMAWPANKFGLLASRLCTGREEGLCEGASSSGSHFIMADSMGVGLGKPKCTWPSEFDAGRAPVKPDRQEKEPSGPKKGPTNHIEAKGKALTCLEAWMDSSTISRGPGVFTFSIWTLGEGERDSL